MDILDQSGYGDPTPGLTLSGQTLVLGGGGLRDQIVPSASEDATTQYIRRYALVPIGLARNDSVTVEHCLSADSLGIANQPVFGGISAPNGLIPVDQWTQIYVDANERSYSQDVVPAPQSTRVDQATLFPTLGGF